MPDCASNNDDEDNDVEDESSSSDNDTVEELEEESAAALERGQIAIDLAFKEVVVVDEADEGISMDVSSQIEETDGRDEIEIDEKSCREWGLNFMSSCSRPPCKELLRRRKQEWVCLS